MKRTRRRLLESAVAEAQKRPASLLSSRQSSLFTRIRTQTAMIPTVIFLLATTVILTTPVHGFLSHSRQALSSRPKNSFQGQPTLLSSSSSLPLTKNTWITTTTSDDHSQYYNAAAVPTNTALFSFKMSSSFHTAKPSDDNTPAMKNKMPRSNKNKNSNKRKKNNHQRMMMTTTRSRKIPATLVKTANNYTTTAKQRKVARKSDANLNKHRFIPTTTTEISPYYRHDVREMNESNNLVPIHRWSRAQRQWLRDMLAQRYHARKRHDYDQVQTLDAQLLHGNNDNNSTSTTNNTIVTGIRVYDYPPIWTRLPRPPSMAHLRRRLCQRREAMRLKYGPQGHPYRQVGVEESRQSYREIQTPKVDHPVQLILVHEVHQLLAQLQIAFEYGPNSSSDSSKNDTETVVSTTTSVAHNKGSRVAQAITLELEIHGVRIHHEFQQWTLNPWHEFVNETVFKLSKGNEYRLVEQTLASTTNTTKTTAMNSQQSRDKRRLAKRVESLVQARADALVCEDHYTAACLAHELYQTYRVLMDDSQLTYYYRDDFQNTGRQPPAPPQPGSMPSSSFSRNNNIMNSNHIMMTHPLLCWPLQDPYASPNYRLSQHSRSFANTNSMNGTIAIHERVRALVLDRIHKREEGKFREADALRRELWETYHVGVNDRLQQYSLGGVFDNDDSRVLRA